jgi:hypothetical protein
MSITCKYYESDMWAIFDWNSLYYQKELLSVIFILQFWESQNNVNRSYIQSPSNYIMWEYYRSEWPCDLRHELCSPARTMRSWVLIPLNVRMSVLCEFILCTGRRRWVDNIKMDLREIGWDGVYWIDRAQDRDQWRALVNTVLNLRVPWNAGEFLRGWQLTAPQERLSSINK